MNNMDQLYLFNIKKYNKKIKRMNKRNIKKLIKIGKIIN